MISEVAQPKSRSFFIFMGGGRQIIIAGFSSTLVCQSGARQTLLQMLVSVLILVQYPQSICYLYCNYTGQSSVTVSGRERIILRWFVNSFKRNDRRLTNSCVYTYSLIKLRLTGGMLLQTLSNGATHWHRFLRTITGRSPS